MRHYTSFWCQRSWFHGGHGPFRDRRVSVMAWAMTAEEKSPSGAEIFRRNCSCFQEELQFPFWIITPQICLFSSNRFWHASCDLWSDMNKSGTWRVTVGAENKERSGDLYKLCPRCGNFSHINEKQNFCQVCGELLIDKCPHCREPIYYPTARFCPVCGERYRKE